MIKLRILVADDHGLVRRGARALLGDQTLEIRPDECRPEMPDS
jgi:DNA-binding NarL/FixJ family response regulator